MQNSIVLMLKNDITRKYLVSYKNCTHGNYFCRVSSEKFGYGSGRVNSPIKIFGSGTGREFCIFTSGRVNFGSGNYPTHPYTKHFQEKQV